MPLLSGTSYTGTASKIANKYWFDRVQTGLTVKNNDSVNKITVYVADNERTLAPGETFVFDEEFEYFHVKTKNKTASFTATVATNLTSLQADNAQQNYSRKLLPSVLDEGKIIEGFENAADWTVTGTGTVTANTAQFQEGSQALKVNVTTNAGSVVMEKSLTSPRNLFFANRRLFLRFYVHQYANAITSLASLKIEFAVDTAWVYYCHTTISLKNLHKGWNCIALPINRELTWTFVSSAWTDTFQKIRLTITADTGVQGAITLDSLKMGFKGVPKFVVMFDDGHKSVRDIAFPYMAAKNIPGTFYVSQDRIGVDPYLGTDDLLRIQSFGWTIANHTKGHTAMSGTDSATFLAQIKDHATWLSAQGFNGSKHVAYPGGSHDDNTVLRMAKYNMYTGRSTQGYNNLGTIADEQYRLNIIYMTNNFDLTTLKYYLDLVRDSGTTGFLVFHRISDTPADNYDILTSKFYGVIDYLDNNNCDCITIDDWYKGNYGEMQ